MFKLNIQFIFRFNANKNVDGVTQNTTLFVYFHLIFLFRKTKALNCTQVFTRYFNLTFFNPNLIYLIQFTIEMKEKDQITLYF